MDIKKTLGKYKTLGHYFDPEYERENEVLNEFKQNNPTLTEEYTNELISLIKNSTDINDKYFVADLLYLYDNLSSELIELLINTAINHEDPSFNRIFIQPCINNIGFTLVAENLIWKYQNGSTLDTEGVKRLMYWIRPEETNETGNSLRELVKKLESTFANSR